MAIAKTDNTIESIRGRCGGVYFKKDSAGQHIQAMPRRVRKFSMESPVIWPSSPGGSRAAYIKSFTYVAGQWLGIAILYIPLLILWQMFAKKEDYKKGKKKPRKLNNRQWFVHYNVWRNAAGLPIYITPPRSSVTLPAYVARGSYLNSHEKSNMNFYEKDGLIHGRPWYGKDTNKYDTHPYTLWSDGSDYYISPAPSLSGEWLWWKKTGLDPVGIYDPNPEHPELDTMIVNF
jgi:hypothetical protein